jgi:hypothetical protein
MTIQYDNLNNQITAVGSATNIPINIQPKGTGGLNLLGSGTNFLTNSASFATTWTNIAGTLTGSQSDPFGGSTAFLLVPTVTNTNHWLFSAGYGIATSPYTLSVYVKASGYNLVYLSDVGNGAYTCSYNLSAVTATPNLGCTGTIFSIGNSWFRITLTTTTTISTNSRFAITGYPVGATLGQFGASFAGDGTSGIVIYGAQAEFGSVANTYVPTTTTAIYGTPTLTLSGVAGVGLQSDGSLYVQPAGTGALQAQATTGTAVGGNARGANAVDWSTSRAAAAYAAIGPNSVISGGSSNFAAVSHATVAGGVFNYNAGLASFIGAGQGNTINGSFASVVTGYTNTANGIYNFIGGGFTNSGTASAAVTTQSATMNGTTAVTLAASNASIKVGQYISGGSIGSDTYVAAVSGTSLTLSKIATGSSTSTLSFFTPHGVVVGGGNNQATGSYSFIGGGGDAGTAANRNVASGDWSTVAGGNRNTASGKGSFVGGNGGDGANFYSNTASGVSSAIVCGTNNTASGLAGFIGAGITNNATATYGFIGGGNSNTANGFASAIVGGVHGNARSIVGNHVFPACVTPIANASGVSQTALLVLAKQTTDATPTALCSDPNAAGTGNQVILPNNSAYYFRGEIVSGVTGGGDTKGFFIEGVIKRGANAASTALVGTPTVTSNYADAGASTWTIAVTADTTNGGLAVTFTGQASTTIRTVAQIRTTEMTY